MYQLGLFDSAAHTAVLIQLTDFGSLGFFLYFSFSFQLSSEED